MKESRNCNPSMICPLLSARSFSPASCVASAGFHVAGTPPGSAGLDHFTMNGKFCPALVTFSAIRKFLYVRNALQNVFAGQLLSVVMRDAMFRFHCWGGSTRLPALKIGMPDSSVLVHWFGTPV